MKIEVTVYHLEMMDKSWFVPSKRTDSDFTVSLLQKPNPKLNRDFYTSVGKNWYWVDRLSWTDEQWKVYADRPEMKTWVACVGGKQAGYYELETQSENNIEITHFGLLNDFVGQGLGSILLTHAIDQAWQAGAKRIWLHTCSLDHPKALVNYKARGFKLFKMETRNKEISD